MKNPLNNRGALSISSSVAELGGKKKQNKKKKKTNL